VTLPSSFREIEHWLESAVEQAINQRPDAEDDTTSSIKILFLNEKRCKKHWKDEEFDVTRLHPILRITDWTTAHYMTTYCRFPLPFDTDDDHGSTPEAMGHDWDWRYTISHPFDWDMLWAYFPQTRTSVGIMRTWFDGYDSDFVDMECIVETFAGPTLGHPMLLGLFALQTLTSDAMANVREKGNRLYEVQCRTGFHVYSRLRTTDAAGDEGPDLAVVTREVLGAAAHLTGWDNATPQLAGFARFIMSESARFQTSKWALDTRSFKRLCDYIDQQTEKQISDIDGAKRDAMAWLATATFVMQGVLNLVSQRDANVNIELARNSNRIALDTKRDATSMMAIAFLTMVFLPATFTSVSIGVRTQSSLPYLSNDQCNLEPPLHIIMSATWADSIASLVLLCASFLLRLSRLHYHFLDLLGGYVASDIHRSHPVAWRSLAH
jgi:hypothetical protein